MFDESTGKKQTLIGGSGHGLPVHRIGVDVCGPETGGKCDNKWRVHKPSECKGLEFLAAGSKRNSDDQVSTSSKKKELDKKKKLRLALNAKVAKLETEIDEFSDSE